MGARARPCRPWAARGLIALLATSLLAACQWVGPAAVKRVVGYSPLYDQADEFRDLVDKGDLAAAKTFYVKNQAFFREKRANNGAALSDFATKINKRYDPKLTTLGAALDYRDDEASWRQQKEAIVAASSALADYDSFVLVREAPYRSPAAVALDAKLDAVRQAYRTNALAALVKDSKLTEENFFVAYPSTLGDGELFSSALPQLTPRLETMSSDDVLSFARLYRAELRADTETAIGRMALTKGLQEEGRSFDPAKLLRLFDRMSVAGLSSKQGGSTPFAVVLIDGPAAPVSAFPVTIADDLPVPIAKLSDDDVARDRLAGFDRAVLIRVRKTTATRKIVAQSPLSSTFVAGYRTERNPDYELARLKVIQAQNDLQNVRRQNALADDGPQITALQSISAGLAAALRLAAEQKAESNLQRAMAELRATPTTIEKEITQPYEYSVAKVAATRSADIDFVLVEHGSDKARKFTHSVERSKTFELVYGLHEKDEARQRILATAQTEDGIARWEASELKLSGHELLASLSETRSDEVSLAALHHPPASIQTGHPARDAVYSGGTTSRDRRFSSVVIVYNPKGALGSGFFVRSDVIMTNRHVVEGSGLAKIVTFDGREATGTVIATDIDRDLALIRVPLQGPAVAFPKGGEIEPGTSVDAIGHPKGLTFSITRGIVSSLRMISLTVGRKVAYVQTDTALSPGNSGGPLFRGNEVVGVNTWGRVDEGAQNLNFAVDYREALAFIHENL